MDTDAKKALQRELLLRDFYHGQIDGDWGSLSQEAFDAAITYTTNRNMPARGVEPEFSALALAMILAAEGIDQPSRWPGGSSGITIGRGDDLGYQSAGEFADNWQAILPSAAYVLLLDAIGYKGAKANAIAHR